MILLAINFVEVLPILVGGGAIVALITWWRFHKKDDAEKEKLLAEAGKIKAEKEVSVAETAMKQAEWLGKEYRQTRMELADTERKLDEALAKADRHERDFHLLQHDFTVLQQRLSQEIEQNERMTKQVEELMRELAIYKKRGPDSSSPKRNP